MKSSLIKKTLFIISLFVNVLLVLQIYASLSGWSLSLLFNSDALYLPSIFKDVFIDKTGFEGWHLNAAPNFFPEWPVYFFIRLLSGNFIQANIAYAVLYVLAVGLLTAAITKVVFKKPDISLYVLINAGFSLFLFQYFFNNNIINTSYLLLTGYHGGAYLMALLAMLSLFQYLKTGKTLHVVLLLVWVYLGVLSDRLLIMYYVVPSLTGLFFMGNKDLKKPLIIAAVGSVLTTVLAMFTYNMIKISGYFYFIGLSSYKKFDITRAGDAFVKYTDILTRMFHSGAIGTIIILLFVLSIIIGGFLSFYFIFSRKKIFANNTLKRFLIVMLTAYVIIVALTPIIHGTFLGLAHLRYNFSSFYVAVSLVIILLFMLTRLKPLYAKVFDGLVIAVLLVVIGVVIQNLNNQNLAKGLTQITNYYPEDVANIDKLAREHGLQYGVGNYWFAKKTTMFSKENVRIYTVNEYLSPWFHVTNHHWYFRDNRGKYGNPRFGFILLNDLEPTGKLFDMLKPHADTLTSDKVKILKVPEFAYKKRNQIYLLDSK
jgi:hypothetical protein